MEMCDISTIKPYLRNAKKHSKKQIKQVANSIKEFGFNQPIVVDKNNVVIVGHGRLEASKMLGLKEVPILQVDLTKEQAKAYRLADNKLNESDWDMQLVIEELKGLSDEMIDLTGFSADLIIEPEANDDDVPEVPKIPKSKLGDVYQLGEHRLICGNSLDKDTIDKLIGGGRAQMCFTDPPYNVDYTGGMGTHEKNDRDGIMNDKMSKTEFFEFLSEVSKRIVENVGGGVYICMSSSEIDTLKKVWEENGGHWQSFIIWVKNNFTLSRADFQHTYEPILYGWANGVVNHYFSEDRDRANVWEDLREVKTEFKDGCTTITFQGFKVKIDGKVEKGEVIRKKQHTDIWRYNKPIKSEEHPTMKPVALCEEAIKASSRKNDIVLDLFGGSGSTLIACEKLNRKCFMCELDAKYVDVIVKRWEDYTNKKAVKIN